MAGNASDIALASNAMLLLGGSTIASFTEESAEAQIAANLFEHSYRLLLATHRWRFAVKQERLARLTQTPEKIFNYMFQLPTDIIYLIRTIDSQRYEIYGDKLYSNSTDVTIEYVYNIESDKIPSHFAKAVEFYLASQFAIPLTGDTEKASYYTQQYEKALVKAKFIDSSARPNQTFVNNRYTDVRNRGSRSSGNY